MLFFMCSNYRSLYSFFFNDTATTEIYTLSLHDALPIFWIRRQEIQPMTTSRSKDERKLGVCSYVSEMRTGQDRKSTRLNSSHVAISYAVFCLKKKKKKIKKSKKKKITKNDKLESHIRDV